MGLIVEKNPWNEVMRTLATMFPAMEERELRRIQHKMEMEVKKAQLKNYEAEGKEREEESAARRGKREREESFYKRMANPPPARVKPPDVTNPFVRGPVLPEIDNPEREPWGEQMFLEGTALGAFDTPGVAPAVRRTLMDKTVRGEETAAAENTRATERFKTDENIRQFKETYGRLPKNQADAGDRGGRGRDGGEEDPILKRHLTETAVKVKGDLDAAEGEVEELRAEQASFDPTAKGFDLKAQSRVTQKLNAALRKRDRLRLRYGALSGGERGGPSTGDAPLDPAAFAAFAVQFRATHKGATDEQVIAAYKAQQ